MKDHYGMRCTVSLFGWRALQILWPLVPLEGVVLGMRG